MRIGFLGRFLPALVLMALPMAALADGYIGVSVGVAPPPLPVYVQPPCPEPGYVWMPGYWAWGPYGYYWVPGTWVLPPEVGLLWTPGYWGWEGGMYLWHAGYWGPQVGFYGGIDYGFGYDGDGFDGGYWRGGTFFYNRAVMHVGPGFAYDEYYRRPRHDWHFDHRRFDRVSFNGGPHGVFARPNRFDRIAARERRFGPTVAQRRHDFLARGDRVLRDHFNHGRPPIAATDRPGHFHGHDVFAARGAARPVFRRGARSMPLDRPAWAASPRDTGPRFAARRRGSAGFQRAHHPAARAWAAPRYRRQPSGDAYRVGPHFQARSVPYYQYRPAPHFRARSVPHYQYRPAPHFQAHSVPHYRYRPAPHFQARPAPRYRYHAAPHFQARPAPRFRGHGGRPGRGGPHHGR